MNRTQKIFGVFFFSAICLWIAFVVLIAEFVLLAFANTLIPSILYQLVGVILVLAALSTYTASAIRTNALKVKFRSAYVPEASGLNQWVCQYCQTTNNDENGKCVNCSAPKKVA